VLTPQLDTSTPMGRLVFNMVSAIAQFEREIMLERQREGIAKAKAEGKYKGRAPAARAKSEEALTLLKEGMGATEVARKLGIGRASVYRILRSRDREIMRPDAALKKAGGTIRLFFFSQIEKPGSEALRRQRPRLLWPEGKAAKIERPTQSERRLAVPA